MNANSEIYNYEASQVSSQTPPVCTVSNLIGFFIGDFMKKIDVSTPAHPNTFALVDSEDYAIVSRFKWTAVKFQRSKTLYAQREVEGKKITMHREIMGISEGAFTDHMDGNGLNNQKSNLRCCTHAQNMQNRGKAKNNKSGYKGVHWCNRENKWVASIGFRGKQKTIGGFFCLIKAARAYDKAAIKYHGEFARLNFPEEESK